METKQQLQTYLQDIEKWEKDQKGLWFWEKLGRLPFKLLDKLTPAFIQEKLGLLISEMGSYVQTGGKYLISEKSILQKVRAVTSQDEIITISDIGQISIQDMIKLSTQLQKDRTKFATLQGASTGFGGFITLAIDIPVILGIALKTLQEIAMIHGYDPNDKQERIFIIKCIQFASSDIVGKEAILKELSTLHDPKRSSEEMISQLKGWQEVFFTYRDHFGWKKLFQAVPVAGMIFGAYANKTMIQDITEAGTMLYRKRRIIEKINEVNNIAPQTSNE